MNKTIHELNSLAQAQADDELIIYDVSEGESKKIQVQALNNPNYSTTEQKTGGTWIDGKPIYRRVFVCATQKTISAGWNTLTNTDFPNITDLLGVDTIVNANARATNAGYLYNVFILDVKTNNQIRFYGVAGTTFNIGTSIIVEYTKTTD